MDYTSEVSIAIKRSPWEALSTALEKLSEPLRLNAGLKHIIIKPSIFDPRLVGNTTLGMVQAVVNLFGNTAPISIVESDNPYRTASEAFTECGYDSLVRQGVRLVNLSGLETKATDMGGHFWSSRDMPDLLLEEGSLFINIATLKAEPDVCTLGAGIKNLFGLVPEPDKSVYHKKINPILMDLLKRFRPSLSIIDLTELVIGRREEGRVKPVGGVIVGKDPIAVDAVCASLLGYEPMKIGHLRMAYELGLGEALPDRIKIRGTSHQKTELQLRLQNKNNNI